MKKVLVLFCFISFSLAAQPLWLKEGLVAHYPFNGHGLDQSGNDHHANLHGSVTGAEDRFGSPTGALVIQVRDEISSVLEDSGIHFDSGASVCGWVKVTSLKW